MTKVKKESLRQCDKVVLSTLFKCYENMYIWKYMLYCLNNKNCYIKQHNQTCPKRFVKQQSMWKAAHIVEVC